MNIRNKAVNLVGVNVEEEIFKRTTTLNYAYIVRKVMQGSSIDEALEIKPLLEEQKVYEVTEGDLTCPSCKSRKIIRKEMQTRSADESATVFCQCFDCKKRFKF